MRFNGVKSEVIGPKPLKKPNERLKPTTLHKLESEIKKAMDAFQSIGRRY